MPFLVLELDLQLAISPQTLPLCSLPSTVVPATKTLLFTSVFGVAFAPSEQRQGMGLGVPWLKRGSCNFLGSGCAMGLGNNWDIHDSLSSPITSPFTEKKISFPKDGVSDQSLPIKSYPRTEKLGALEF